MSEERHGVGPVVNPGVPDSEATFPPFQAPNISGQKPHMVEMKTMGREETLHCPGRPPDLSESKWVGELRSGSDLAGHSEDVASCWLVPLSFRSRPFHIVSRLDKPPRNFISYNTCSLSKTTLNSKYPSGESWE